MVRASWVTRWGIPLVPMMIFFTLQSLYCKQMRTKAGQIASTESTLQTGPATLVVQHVQPHQGSHLGLLSCDAMHSEASLHIVDETEVLASLINADHICVNMKHLSLHSINYTTPIHLFQHLFTTNTFSNSSYFNLRANMLQTEAGNTTEKRTQKQQTVSHTVPLYRTVIWN